MDAEIVLVSPDGKQFIDKLCWRSIPEVFMGMILQIRLVTDGPSSESSYAEALTKCQAYTSRGSVLFLRVEDIRWEDGAHHGHEYRLCCKLRMLDEKVEKEIFDFLFYHRLKAM